MDKNPSTDRDLIRDVERLFPLCRSITGDGLRESLSILAERVPMRMHEIPTGTRVYDWEVPKEWNIREAWIKDTTGRVIVSFGDSSLHVVNYSEPVDKRVSLTELKQHLHSLPDHPEWIPYRTSYYNRTWGFCLSQKQMEDLRDDHYDVFIDASLSEGSLTYGEFLIPGDSPEEFLFSCHSCHPSLANDNLSGMVVGSHLAQWLTNRKNRYTYRFLWIPGTIGSITWLALNQQVLRNVVGGLVLSCLGDKGSFHYKRSRQSSALIDRVVCASLAATSQPHQVMEFSPLGYDERQYCSPGINLPIGCFMRTPNGRYPEYHTSADNLTFVTEEALGESLRTLMEVVGNLEVNDTFRSLNPCCEPQLGRRGLYKSMGGLGNSMTEEAVLWVLNMSDGANSLLDIAERSGLRIRNLASAADLLCSVGLLVRNSDPDGDNVEDAG